MTNSYDFLEQVPREGGGLGSGDLSAPWIALSWTCRCHAGHARKTSWTVKQQMRRLLREEDGSGGSALDLRADSPVKNSAACVLENSMH